VHHDVKATELLDVATEVKRNVAGDPTCIPSDIDPERISFAHSIDTIKQILNPLVCLGWKVFKRVKVRLRVVFLLNSTNFLR
jgi:hypothetical protein